MSDLAWSEPPPRHELLAQIKRGLSELGLPLRVVAENVLGAEARIDLVTVDPDGHAGLVLLSTGEDDLALVALALAQRAWVEARIPDWIQLAPDLGLRPEGPLRTILVAPDFSAPAQAAVRAADPEDVDLVRYRCLATGNGSGIQVLLEPVRLGGTGLRAPGPRRGPPPAARFRTGLADGDLSLTPDERRNLD